MKIPSTRVVPVTALVRHFIVALGALGLAASLSAQQDSPIDGPVRKATADEVALTPVELRGVEARERVGSDISIDGDVAIVASLQAAYVLRWSEDAWVFEARLDPKAAGDGASGRTPLAVSISGDTALVGDMGHGHAGRSSGAVLIYERGDAGRWHFKSILSPDDAAAHARFGAAVALSGDRCLVGANGYTSSANHSGAGYVFERGEDGAWGQKAKLLVEDEAGAYAQVGSSVALDGDYCVMSGKPRNQAPIKDVGPVIVYRAREDGTWHELQSLTPRKRTMRFFGVVHDLAFEGGYLAVGGYADGRHGLAVLYGPGQEGGFIELEQMEGFKDSAALISGFGGAIGMSGDAIIVGAPHESIGRALLFRRGESGLALAGGTPTHDVGRFGLGVAIDGDRVLIGSPYDSLEAGAVHAWRFDASAPVPKPGERARATPRTPRAPARTRPAERTGGR
ncbi:MAG: FG-GAP repeat protein [Planctomycetota bacterium]